MPRKPLYYDSENGKKEVLGTSGSFEQVPDAPTSALPVEYPATYAAMQTSITSDPSTKRDFFVSADETNGGAKSSYRYDGVTATRLAIPFTTNSSSNSSNEIMSSSAVQDLVKLSSNGISNQSAPYIIWHRGGSNLAPENTLKAFKYASARGAKFIEMDVQILADGSLGVCHDDTIDYMTTSSGNVINQSSIGWSNLTVDCTSWLGPDWPNITGLTLFEDVLKEFANKVILVPEIKDSRTDTATKLLALLQKYGVSSDHVIVQSFSDIPLQIIKAGGYQTMILGSGLSAATVQSQGHQWAGIVSTDSSANVAALKAVGVKVVMWTVNTQYDYTQSLAKGVDGVFSDDPLYVSNTHTKKTTDPYLMQSRWDGQMPSPSTILNDKIVSTGNFTTSGAWGMNNTLAYHSSLQGWGCPINNDLNASSYKIELTTDIVSGTGWFSIFLSTNDLPFEDLAATGVNGYHILIRKTGVLQIYKVTNGVAASLNSFSGTARTDGDSLAYRVTVSSTQITILRIANGDTLTVTDNTFRGLPYFRFGTNNIVGRFKSVTVTVI